MNTGCASRARPHAWPHARPQHHASARHSCSSLSERPAPHRHQRSCSRHHVLLAASSAASQPAESFSGTTGAAVAKQHLLRLIAGTERGAAATSMQRGHIAEAQVAVEGFGGELDFQQLAGLWRLLYTTASDVLPLVATSKPGLLPLRVSNVYQQFSPPQEGSVRNIIDFSIWPLLQEGNGARACVEAMYEVRSARRIALTFQAAGVSDIAISPALEAVLAPAILPRTWLNQQILLAIQEFRLRLPLQTRRPHATSRSMQVGGGEYLLTYLDDNMLIGRAEQGVFIFSRETHAL